VGWPSLGWVNRGGKEEKWKWAGEERVKRNWAGGERDRKWAELVDGFSFLFFSKISNSTRFYLFHYELTRAPKIINFFVYPSCNV
jgi:hypothetical protein